MRAFLALDLERSWRESSTRLRETVIRSDPRWTNEKWVRPDLLHVTLVFFGDIDPDVVNELIEASSPLIEKLGRVELLPTGVCARPDRRHARLLWVDFEPVDALASLAAGVALLARGLGVEVEVRPFLPHQTLVRARRPVSVNEQVLALTTRQVIAQGSVSVPSVTLFESVLGQTGPEYRELHTWKLT